MTKPEVEEEELITLYRYNSLITTNVVYLQVKCPVFQVAEDKSLYTWALFEPRSTKPKASNNHEILTTDDHMCLLFFSHDIFWV